MKNPEEIVSLMLQHDRFSQWLGIEIMDLRLGSCTLQITVTDEMLNGHHIAHGGISYSISDSALAFAANSRGHKCVSIETSISHIRKCHSGDVLTVKATEINRGRTIGIYEIETVNQDHKKISHFKGTVHVSTEIW
jgi:acyl-CoA thioesterase